MSRNQNHVKNLSFLWKINSFRLSDVYGRKLVYGRTPVYGQRQVAPTTDHEIPYKYEPLPLIYSFLARNTLILSLISQP